jgi:hypothetical protein
LGRAACRLLQRDNRAYEHIHETASASAARTRTCCQARVPQAFAHRSPTELQVSLGPMNAPCATRRESTTGSGFAPDRQLLWKTRKLSRKPAEVQPRTDRPEVKGSQPFGLLASSPPSKAAEHPFVTYLLPRRPGELPPRLAWSVAPGFPGGEGPRSASQVGQDLRSDAFPRRLTLSRKPGCFPPIVPTRAGGSPLCQRRSVSPSRRP